MPVRKFRSVADMPSPDPLPPLTAATLRRAFEHMDLSLRLFPPHLEPGVHKFRTMEEANRHREARLIEQIRARRDSH